ncbi:MAG: hypothetical protein KatS3mg064_2494 [Tepidiforma sp.]|nr:hypothetical protein [Tepidiforma sp.]GIW19337.1 MAG: hypothetical protein KatS3mg064_2494 [Tepidiforma sp.]
MKGSWRRLHESEEGHVTSAAGALIAGAGAVLVGIGAANGTGWLAVAGGIIAGAGILGWEVLRHYSIDQKLMARLDRLESKGE